MLEVEFVGSLLDPSGHTGQFIGQLARQRRERYMGVGGCTLVRHRVGSLERQRIGRRVRRPRAQESSGFELGPAAVGKLEAETAGAPQCVESALPTECAGECVGAIAHIGGLLEPVVGRELRQTLGERGEEEFGLAVRRVMRVAQRRRGTAVWMASMTRWAMDRDDSGPMCSEPSSLVSFTIESRGKSSSSVSLT